MSSRRLILGILLLVGFCFQNCSQNTSTSGGSSGSTGSGSTSMPSSGISGLPSFNFNAGISLISQILGSVSSVFNGGACISIGPCSSSTPSAENVTVNCSSGGFTYAGTTPVTYNGPSCNLIESNEIGVMPSLNVTGSNENLQLSSANANDYRGNSIGGGALAMYSLTSLTLTIPGVHFSGAAAGQRVDLAERTTTALSGSASFGASGLTATIGGGQIELIDNVAQSVATLSVNGLTFGTSCACPVAGSLTGSLSGGGSVSITFSSTCGQVSLDAAGATATVQVHSCQL